MFNLNGVTNALSSRMNEIDSTLGTLPHQLIESLFNRFGDVLVGVYHNPHQMGVILAVIGSFVMSRAWPK